MDVGELLNFKPSVAPKRPSQAVDDHDPDLEEEYFDDPNESYEKRAAKRRKLKKAAQKRIEEQRLAMLEAEAAAAAASSNNSNSDGPSAEVLAKLAKADEAGPDDDLDESKLKRMILNFEKKIAKNQELRIKFPDEPAKFMASEVELHDAVQEMRVVSTVPDLYPILVDMECIATLLGLLSHENSDIAVAVVDLLQELTDIDNLNESEEGTNSLVQALAAQQICALLVQNLDRLNDSNEEANGIHNSLAIIENLIEFRPEICQEAAEAGLLLWLLTKRLKVKVTFDANKLYASEILSILIQNEPKNRSVFSELAPGGVVGGAMDSLLQQLAYYKR